MYQFLKLSVKFASQIYHENINNPLDGAYLADFGIDINHKYAYVHLLRYEMLNKS